jgi:hypothetical protein
LDSETGADVSVDIGDVKIITIVKKYKALICGAAGLLLGAAIAFATETEGGLSTALIGVGIGEMIGKDKTIQIEGKSVYVVKQFGHTLKRRYCFSILLLIKIFHQVIYQK